MLTKERHDIIVKTVNDKNTVTVAQLVELLGVSEATVRRDLNALDKKGLLIKVFGGATAIQEPTRVKEEQRLISKRKILLLSMQHLLFTMKI